MKAEPKIQGSLLRGFMKEIPENEFLATIDEIIDFEEFRSTLNNCYENFGRCAYDPVILLKLLFLERFYDLSDRVVVAEATDRISFRLFLGLGRAIYRGINRVERQIALTVLAVNMKRLAAIYAQSRG